MTMPAIFTVLVVVVMLIALMMEIIEADVIVFAALALLLTTGIITPKEALEGFANKGMMTVAILFIVAYAAQASGFMQFIADRIMGKGYQTNMMVYGPGGYRARDYLTVGIPLNILYMVVSILVIPLFRKF